MSSLLDNVYSNLDKLEAKIQSIIADFLDCRLQLINARSAGNDQLTITKINTLLAKQEHYEADLPGILEVINRWKSDLSGVTVSEIGAVGTFYLGIREHIAEVGKITSASSVSSFSLTALWSQYKYWIVGLGILLIWKHK